MMTAVTQATSLVVPEEVAAAFGTICVFIAGLIINPTTPPNPPRKVE